MDNRICKLGLLSALLIVVCAGCRRGQDSAATSPEPIDSIPQVVMQVQRCSRLYTAEYKVRKIVSHSDEKAVGGKLMGHDFSLKLPLGERSVAIPVDATIKAYIDFSGFSERNVVRHGDRIEVTLPDPEIVLTSTRIDHDGMRQHVPWLRGRFTDAELTQLERQGRQSIVKSIPQMGILATARTNAATLLIPIFEQMGFQRDKITIHFRQDLGPSDLLRRLIQSTTDYETTEQ